MSGPLARIRRLTVRYEGAADDALHGIDLDLLPGERLAVVGESGSGKSTLALAIAGLLPRRAAVAGEIAWPGLGRTPVPGRDIGFVFQDHGSSLNPVLTVGEQVAEVARRHLGLTWSDAYAAARDLLGRVLLPDPGSIVRAFPHQLSGGQRQRVAIAEAIAAGPALLIADEATSALDTIVQAEIVRLLDRLVEDRQAALLFITHDIALAAGFADRIAVFRNGRLIECGEAGSVLRTPASPYTAELRASHIGLATPPFVAEVAS